MAISKIEEMRSKGYYKEYRIMVEPIISKKVLNGFIHSETLHDLRSSEDNITFISIGVIQSDGERVKWLRVNTKYIAAIEDK